MATATLERDGTSVDIPLLSNSSGTPLVVRGIGKPHVNFRNGGVINPRHDDLWSGLEQYTITGRFHETDAYSDAIKLVDLIKSPSQGPELTLNIDMPDYESDIFVAPAAGQDEALAVTYNPGWRDYVEVDLALTRINKTFSGDIDQTANTPTASGSGPIELSYRGTTVQLTSDITVERTVGRPNSVIRKNSLTTYPDHFEKFKSAADRFELSFEFAENTVSKTNEVVDLFTKRLAYSSLTLDFNGLYGMGSFNVVPDGSEAVRHTRQSGYKSSGVIPSVSLRRVYSE